MGRLESSLESWCVKYARTLGIVAAKMKECDGIPDRIFFVPGGKPVIVEFKVRGKRGKGLQEYTQPWYREYLSKNGYTIYHCDTKEEFIEIMEEHVRCRTNVKTCGLPRSLKPNTVNRVISKTKTSKKR